jgi:hypothetical protein
MKITYGHIIAVGSILGTAVFLYNGMLLWQIYFWTAFIVFMAGVFAILSNPADFTKTTGVSRNSGLLMTPLIGLFWLPALIIFFLRKGK